MVTDAQHLTSFMSSPGTQLGPEVIRLIEKLLPSSLELTTQLLKEEKFHHLMTLAIDSHVSEVREACFCLLLSMVSINHSQQAIKLMFYQANLIQTIRKTLMSESSDQALNCAL